MKQNARSGMTLMEIMVVFAVLVLVATGMMFLIRPQEQFAKAKDAHRKNDLNELRKIFESWLGDKGCYPKMSDVCYNAGGGTTCNLCTSHAGSPSLANYTSSVLCDPDSPTKEYLYEIQGNANCPAAFVIYTKLASTYNPTEDLFHCTKFHGCGPAPFFGYDYVVTSPNAIISTATNYFCHTSLNRCSSCGTFTSCQDSINRGVCVEIYGSKASCCASHPGDMYCP